MNIICMRTGHMQRKANLGSGQCAMLIQIKDILVARTTPSSIFFRK